MTFNREYDGEENDADDDDNDDDDRNDDDNDDNDRNDDDEDDNEIMMISPQGSVVTTVAVRDHQGNAAK